MFGLFKKSDDANEKVGPNGHYEGEILCADYAAGDSDHHDMWPHGKGKMTVTLEDGTVEVYEGSWEVGQFHGEGKLTVTKPDGNSEVTEGVWDSGLLND